MLTDKKRRHKVKQKLTIALTKEEARPFHSSFFNNFG